MTADEVTPLAELAQKWRNTHFVSPEGGGMLAKCAADLEASLAAAAGLHRETAELLWHDLVTLGKEGDDAVEAITAALTVAAATGWARCPVTGEAHLWTRSTIKTPHDRQFYDVEACTDCGLYPDAIQPAAAERDA